MTGRRIACETGVLESLGTKQLLCVFGWVLENKCLLDLVRRLAATGMQTMPFTAYPANRARPTRKQAVPQSFRFSIEQVQGS